MKKETIEQKVTSLEKEYNLELKKVNVENTFYTKNPESKRHLGIIGKVRVTPLGYDIRSLSEEQILQELIAHQHDWVKMHGIINDLTNTIRQLYADMGDL